MMLTVPVQNLNSMISNGYTMQNEPRKRRTRRTRIAIAAATLLAIPAVVLGVISGQDSAEASTCYGGQEIFYKPRGTHYSQYFTTSSKCADINLKVAWDEPNRLVKVCFVNGGCQSSYKLATEDWTEITTNVKDGTKYRFYFASSSPWLAAWVAD